MAEMTLDTILFDLREPERTQALEQYMLYDEPVKIKYSGKGTFKRRLRFPNGDVMDVTIPPAGKFVGRRTAIELLYRWGRGGVYRGKDMRTGLTATSYRALKPEDRKIYEGMELNFDNEYLYDATNETVEKEPEVVASASTAAAVAEAQRA